MTYAFDLDGTGTYKTPSVDGTASFVPPDNVNRISPSLGEG